uniref:Putative root storage protein n=1 Tax=Ranunculus asiaticus TaxID=529701 RepID=B3GEA4_9MAGN|nr:putative root storage protein [Ranunculus asiaticus]
MMKPNLHVFSFFFFLLLVVASVSSEDCSYTFLVKTGTVSDAGSDSMISVTLKDAQGTQVKIDNLAKHGLMGPGHDYFENGNLDTFSVNGVCTNSAVCELTLISDGTGNKPGWYVDYVRVITSGAKFGDIQFDVYGWLAKDEPPYLLTRTFSRCGPKMPEMSII